MPNFSNSFAMTFGGSTNFYAPRLVVKAEFSHSLRAGGSVLLAAYEEGVLVDFPGTEASLALPDSVQGVAYSRRIENARAYFSGHRMMVEEKSTELERVLGQQIGLVAESCMGNKAANEVVWSLFWHLVLSKEDSTFVDAMLDHRLIDSPFSTNSHDELKQLRRDALEQRASLAV